MNQTELLFEKIKDNAQNTMKAYERGMYDDLKKVEKRLEDTISGIVNQYAAEYKLLYQNDSSKEIKLYELSGRVKEPESLREKIVRDQLFCYMQEASSDEDKINIIKLRIDDLIGIRYLVSLSQDCTSMHSLIKEKISEFNEKGINFFNIDNNPQKMKNGRLIYRLKGSFEGYNFELQIKSKIDSAWADIEHMLFYKDFNFSYIQGTNKEVMNKIGDLLEKIDVLMLQVRESQEEYDKKVDEMDFNQYLRKRYVELVRSKLGSSYVLTEYRNCIFKMFATFGSETREKILSYKDCPKENNIVEFDFEDDLKENALCKNYMKLKNMSVELSIFESLYYEWIACLEKKYKKIKERDLKQYLNTLISCLTQERNYGHNFAEWVSGSVIAELNSKLQSISNRLFVFDKEEHEMVYSYWKASHVDAESEWELIDNYDDLRNSLDGIIIRFMMDHKNAGIYLEELLELVDQQDNEVFNDLLFQRIRENTDTAYNETATNSSGKTKKENMVVRLILDASKKWSE